MAIASSGLKQQLQLWFFEGLRESSRRRKTQHQDAWWKVMCLTGVDYFSSLGYAPGIAFLAAGLLSPLATVILVILNLFGALPVYCKVAEKSPNGQGSISMLEHLLPGWKGKTLVLCLLGFAATDFIITITLSAADAASHAIQNPWLPAFLHDRMLLTMTLLTLLGMIFLKGFREALGLSVVLVLVYLVLNLIVVFAGFYHLFLEPVAISNWLGRLFQTWTSPVQMIIASALVFPKLALGMSGFETGVAVMPHVQGDASDTAEAPLGRIKNTKWLLRTAALIMGFFLLSSALVTTTLIPAEKFAPGGEADGRALAYLAHLYLGQSFGTLYDLSTICILWFAGASALTGLLNLVPRYLPRFGMAPAWASATRPLVMFFTAVAYTVTVIFNADVDAQGSAYATGVLVLMTSAALASTLVTWKKNKVERVMFLIITLVFIYTTITNCIQRPEGIHIAIFFIGTILVLSMISRVMRSTELRVRRIVLDEVAQSFVREASKDIIRIVAHRPGLINNYGRKEKEARDTHNITQGDIIFLEVTVSDASDFQEEVLKVQGVQEGSYKILRCESPAVPNTLAALLLYIRDHYDRIPHLYLGWTEGNPLTYILKYLFFGEGENAPVTREILREYEKDPERRPRIHVG